MQSLSPSQPHDTHRQMMLRRVLTTCGFEERPSADRLVGKIYGVVYCHIDEAAVAAACF